MAPGDHSTRCLMTGKAGFLGSHLSRQLNCSIDFNIRIYPLKNGIKRTVDGL